MQLGMIGLGRMGANILRRVMRDGHTAVAFDTNPDSVADLVSDGAEGSSSLEEFVQKLSTPRVAWVMIPAGITDKVVEQLGALMERGDIIINGGNSNYREDYDRAAALAEQGIEYMDVGTSGGVWGLERGYCLMIGGSDAAFSECEPLFASIAPGIGTIDRTHGRTGDPAPRPTAAPPSRPTRRRSPRWNSPSTTSTTWTSPRSPRCGDAVRWSPPGCWTSPRGR
jgi:6-phosphogluconate dehydrogenase